MMEDGELAAGFDANAGIGRTGSPTGGGWQQREANYPDLFPNAAELEAAWYRRTGIYPMHGTIVVKDAVLAKHPWIARSLFDAFSKAKGKWLETLHSGAAQTAIDKKYRALMKIVGDDPLPFGLKENLATVKALEDTAFKQALTPKRMTISEIFVDPERG
jgi:4,5-dihydroxyphthalate decarboxylase